MRRISLFLSICAVLALAPLRPATAQDPRAALLANLRAHVKHVFVLFQENRSFDSYFGTFPGAENLASPLAQAHGFRQHDPLGNQDVAPYRLTDPDLADVDHSRPSLYAKVDSGKMDAFVANEEQRRQQAGVSSENAHRLGLLTMAHEDCDTVPFYWKYASAFTLYDHIFQGMFAPSAPSNINLVSAQTGQTQAARHPAEATNVDDTGPGEPVVNDIDPPFGPYRVEPKVKQNVQTYANLLLTLAGADAPKLVSAGGDDIKDDLALLGRSGKAAIPWGWYQEGFKADASGARPAYVTHHNVPQFFGYLRQSPALWSGVHDLTELLPAITQGTLGDRSVVFVKGGYKNPFGWKPANPDPAVATAFLGDDDHPGYSDSQLSEALVATAVNAIARSKYWNDSAIVITWDDSEGFYDHVPPPQFEECPDRRACGDGPRVALILISPYAKTHAIVSDPGDHASFAKFLGALFDLPALASLPDEAPYLPEGPRDTNPRLTDLLAGFDATRLAGGTPPISPEVAEIPDDVVNTFPAKMSCASLGITPVAVPGELASPPPGFAPRLTQ